MDLRSEGQSETDVFFALGCCALAGACGCYTPAGLAGQDPTRAGSITGEAVSFAVLREVLCVDELLQLSRGLLLRIRSLLSSLVQLLVESLQRLGCRGRVEAQLDIDVT